MGHQKNRLRMTASKSVKPNPMVMATIWGIFASSAELSQWCKPLYARPPKLLICLPTLPVSTPSSRNVSNSNQDAQRHRYRNQNKHPTG